MPDRRSVVAVVEDDASMRKAIERLLAANGLSTESYTSAEEFIARQDMRPATCLVVDIELEGMSGIELRRRLMASGRAIPTIFITGADNSAMVRDAGELGCIRCLIKPFQ